MKIPTPQDFTEAKAGRMKRQTEHLQELATPFLEAVVQALHGGQSEGISPIPKRADVRRHAEDELRKAGWDVKYWEPLGNADVTPHKNPLDKYQ